MNVVHGPNEAGKSSWFAATYAGLAGRRKARGRGTIGQAEFRNRHKPWSGSQWSAGVTVTLDDGLGPGPRARSQQGRVPHSRWPTTGRVVPVSELSEAPGHRADDRVDPGRHPTARPQPGLGPRHDLHRPGRRVAGAGGRGRAAGVPGAGRDERGRRCDCRRGAGLAWRVP